ncbi:MAG: hypothetical protein Q9182_002765 [Xanthomendoza sp. 2 TL-2023]
MQTLLLFSFLLLAYTSAVQTHLLPAHDPSANPDPPGQQLYQGRNPFAATLTGTGPLIPGPMGGRLLPFHGPGDPPFQNYRIVQFWGLTPLEIGTVYQPRGNVNWQPGV